MFYLPLLTHLKEAGLDLQSLRKVPAEMTVLLTLQHYNRITKLQIRTSTAQRINAGLSHQVSVPCYTTPFSGHHTIQQMVCSVTERFLKLQ